MYKKIKLNKKLDRCKKINHRGQFPKNISSHGHEDCCKLLDETPALIWKSGPDRKSIYFNKSWLNFTGRSLEQELGNGWLEGIHSCDLPVWKKNFNQAFSSRKSFKIEFRLRHWDGTYRLVACAGKPSLDIHGKFDGYIGSCQDIHELRQSEIMTEFYYRSLIEISSDFIAVLDARRIINDVSPSVEYILGYRPADLVGRYSLDLVHPDDKLKLISIARDICERKNAEEALREATNKLNAIIQASPLAIILIDQLGKVTSWNSAAESIFGWKEEDIVGQPYPIVPDEFKEEHERMFKLTLAGKSLVGKEVRRKRKDGTIIDVSICTACLYDSRNSLNEILIIIEDISQRRLAREALLKAQFHQKAILDNIPDLVWLKDTESRFIIVNEAAASSHGVSAKDLVGKSDFDISPPDLAQKYRDDDIKVMQSQTRHYTVEPLIDGFGNNKWIETIKTPIFNEKGLVIGTTGIARDITERIQSEKELADSRQKAEEALRMASLGAMAAGIAHEINQPLNSIKVITDGALFWQKKGKEISINKAMSNFTKISAQVDRITEIITHMRSLIHKNQDSAVSQFNPNDAVKDAINLLESQLKSQKIIIKKFLTEPLPMLIGRKSSLEEVVINLLNNAIQAFEKTEIAEREIICTTKFDEKLILEISDNATGIKEENFDKLLDPFFSTKPEGMGLGLFIVHTIVTNLGGNLEIKENNRGGATFKLEFRNFTTNNLIQTAEDCRE